MFVRPGRGRSEQRDGEEADEDGGGHEELDERRGEHPDGGVDAAAKALTGVPRADGLHGEDRPGDADEHPDRTGEEQRDDTDDRRHDRGEPRRSAGAGGGGPAEVVGRERGGTDDRRGRDERQTGRAEVGRPPVEIDARERERYARDQRSDAADDADDEQRHCDEIEVHARTGGRWPLHGCGRRPALAGRSPRREPNVIARQLLSVPRPIFQWMRVLVAGATGFVGSHLLPALVERGHDVVALTRDASDYDPPAGVDVLEADLNDRESLEGVFEGVDAAYYLVHSMGRSEDFEREDRQAARNFVAATRGSGVERVVYLSGLGGHRATLSDHLESRREVEYVLGTGEFDLTVLRAAIVVGDGSTSFRIVRQLAARLPLMITPQWVRTECQPIAVDDMVAYLAGVLDVPETAGETYEVGGPDVLTYGEMVEHTAEILGHSPTMVSVPVLTPRLSAYWVDLVTDVPRDVAHPLIRGLKTRTVVDDDRIRSLVDVDLTPFDEAVERAVA